MSVNGALGHFGQGISIIGSSIATNAGHAASWLQKTVTVFAGYAVAGASKAASVASQAATVAKSALLAAYAYLQGTVFPAIAKQVSQLYALAQANPAIVKTAGITAFVTALLAAFYNRCCLG
jgi:hypothetical protein